MTSSIVFAPILFFLLRGVCGLLLRNFRFHRLTIKYVPNHLKFGKFLTLLFEDVFLGLDDGLVLRLACGFVGGLLVLNLFRPRPGEAVTGAAEVVRGGTVGRKIDGAKIQDQIEIGKVTLDIKLKLPSGSTKFFDMSTSIMLRVS